MSAGACATLQESFTLYLYGELSSDEEERIESHLDACTDCRSALDREKAFHAALSGVEIQPSASLLMECRADLMARVAEEEAPPQPARVRWWERFHWGLALRPAGALTLVAIGFFAARMMPVLNDQAEVGASRVRNVEAASGGRVQIVFDETRQRVVSGRPDDAEIRGLLLAAAKDQSDPGLRAESVDILNAGAQSADVRDVLIQTLQHDQNAGVRLKAMEGLKPFALDPEVRGVLSQVLLSDDNPGLRTQAIDLLTEGAGENLDRQIVGTLQELMGRESNAYVRERSQRALELVNASAQTY